MLLILISSSNEKNSERSDEVSPYLTVSCGQVSVRKCQERLPTGCLFNKIILTSLVYLCVDVCPSHTTHAQPISAARAAVEAPYFALH